MLIINADDFGKCRLATDRILSCYEKGSVTSASAMVFMEDSQRSSTLARECGIDVGLHLNFTEKFTGQVADSEFCEYHGRILNFLTKNKYNFLIYHPTLHKPFEYVFQAQLKEFERLYSTTPSHIDGHHHMHLCSNMLVKSIIPERQKVRRNFSFAPGEKSLPNRMYRTIIDKWLARKYLMTDYLFSLSEREKIGRLAPALALAKTSRVELETHPELAEEFEWLMGDACIQAISTLQIGSYTEL